jgi:hypothetical protein
VKSYVVVFRGDATTGGFPIAISAAPEPVRAALEAGLREIWSFAQDARTDPALRAKARGNIGAIQEALAELS